MHPAEQGLWSWMERPWRAWVSAQAAVVSVIVLGALWLLRPELRALEDIRRDIGHIEQALRQHGRAMAEMPAQASLDKQISAINRSLAGCGTPNREPAVFIQSIDPGRSGKLTWRAFPPSRERGAGPSRWTVSATTDYPGLRRMLNRLVHVSDGVKLASFAVAARGSVLEIEFELAQPAPETDHDK